MNFGARLKDLRDKQKLTQTELAKLTGLHYTQIGRYEKDKTMPSSDVLKKLADVLTVSIDYLIEGSTEETAKSFLHDRDLLRQFKEVEKLNQKDKETVKTLIDAFLSKKKIEDIVNPKYHNQEG